MPLNKQQLGAIFEKMKNTKTGGINPNPKTPRMKQMVHPRLIAPIMPRMAPGAPLAPSAPMAPSGVNENLVGNPRQQRFKKLKNILDTP